MTNSPRSCSVRKAEAFTLIELLVVIAIIAILAAILFPVFAQARAKARQTTCLSNGKQLGLAALSYAQDYDEMYVPVGGAEEPYTVLEGVKNSANAPFNGWSLSLQPYIKSRALFLCPSMEQEFVGAGTCAKFNRLPITNNYSYNYLLGSDDSYPYGDYYQSPTGVAPRTRWDRPRTLAEIVQPSNVIVFQHSNSLQPYGTTWGCTYVTIETPDFINKIRMRVVHNDGDNLSFADGHSKWFQVKIASSSSNATGTGPGSTHYIWPRAGIWMVPSFVPGSTDKTVNLTSVNYDISPTQ